VSTSPSVHTRGKGGPEKARTLTHPPTYETGASTGEKGKKGGAPEKGSSARGEKKIFTLKPARLLAEPGRACGPLTSYLGKASSSLSALPTPQGPGGDSSPVIRRWSFGGSLSGHEAWISLTVDHTKFLPGFHLRSVSSGDDPSVPLLSPPGPRLAGAPPRTGTVWDRNALKAHHPPKDGSKKKEKNLRPRDRGQQIRGGVERGVVGTVRESPGPVTGDKGVDPERSEERG
jgi:hypothetical protein